MVSGRSCLYINRQWFELLCVWPAAWTVALIVLHQSVIAGSSFFLTRLIENFQNAGDYRIYLAGYLASMAIPYLPGCASYVALQSWINHAHASCVNRLASSAFGLTETYRDRETRRSIEAVISRNSFIVISDCLSFLHGFIGFFLNSFLSMLVLGMLLPAKLLAGYFLSVALCLVIVLVSRKLVSRLSTAVEGEFIVYSELLSTLWDNAALGNQYNFALWTKRKSQLADRYYAQSTRLQLTKQSGNLVLACASLGPTVYLIFHVLQAPSADAALIAAVIVNFTRIFHILNSLSSLVYQLLDWSSMTARVRVVFDAEHSLLSATELPSTPTGKITINDIAIDCFEEVARLISSSASGRFTIRGENGSGKTTLLQYLKKALGDRAMLIPSDQGDLVWNVDTNNFSTGQGAFLRIQEAASQATISHLLLDEWDANLDGNNTCNIDQLLDKFARAKVVIEVRHERIRSQKQT